ncbi:MAG: hypothetical protein CMP23_09750 [Rickettsiales bacterium]|nr:hypothetical protein [Rickettsiales bacterium]|tara:strand:+ start:812 stop:1411 length:600 start_codon:yes stop_codon:yes gene_type:complete
MQGSLINWTAPLLSILLLAATLSGCGESEQEKACKDARWAAKAAWNEAERELKELRVWLKEYDVWFLQSRHPNQRIGPLMKEREKKWTMWDGARKAAEDAGEQAWEKPTKAVFTSRKAGQTCTEAERTSPPVQKRGGADASDDEPDDVTALEWYGPGRAALKACAEASTRGELAWKMCQFKEPISAEERALEATTYEFF